MIKDIINKISNEILNSKIVTVDRLLQEQNFCMKKQALTILDLITDTSKRSIKYEQGCEAKLKRATPKIGRWMFSVKCNERWSKGPYDVRFKLLNVGKRYKDMANRQVELSCNCNAWKYNGADFNAMNKDYSERQYSDGSKPNIRDRRRKYLICKHVASCIPTFANYIIPKGYK